MALETASASHLLAGRKNETCVIGDVIDLFPAVKNGVMRVNYALLSSQKMHIMDLHLISSLLTVSSGSTETSLPKTLCPNSIFEQKPTVSKSNIIAQVNQGLNLFFSFCFLYT